MANVTALIYIVSSSWIVPVSLDINVIENASKCKSNSRITSSLR